MNYNEILGEVIRYYSSKLKGKPFDYLKSRKILDPEFWQLGYADGGLTEHLLGKGISKEVIIKYKLCYEDSLKDRFANGIIIPYLSNNVPLTFRFRSLDNTSSARYLSLPRDSFFYKDMYFNIDAFLNSSDYIFICEGEFDTISLSQEGYFAVGCPGVNNIPISYREEILKIKNIYICFDNDRAGNEGSYVFAERLGRACRRIRFPESYDANDFMKDNASQFQNLILNSEDIEPEIYKYELDGVTEYQVSYSSEIALLNIMINQASMISKIIDELGIFGETDSRYFFGTLNSSIFKTILNLYYKCIPIDIATICDNCSVKREKILDISSMNFDTSNYISYCNHLKRAYIGRDALDRGKRLISYVSKKTSTKEGLLSKIIDWEDSILDTDKKQSRLLYGNNLVSERLLGIKKRIYNKKINTGYPDWDNKLAMGFGVRGEISVISGRPREGKSVLKANLIKNLCQMGYCCVNVSPEQGIEIEHDRLDSMLLDRKLIDFYNVNLLQDDSFFNQIQSQIENISNNWKYYLLPDRDVTFLSLVNYLEKISQKQQIDVVFIDLFNKLGEITESGNNERFEINRLINECNKLAKRLNCHICLLHQIHRLTGFNRKDGRPTLEDLKDSGKFEEDAYAVYLVYRIGLHKQDIYDDQMEVIIAKQKQGVCGEGESATIKLKFIKDNLSLYTWEDD